METVKIMDVKFSGRKIGMASGIREWRERNPEFISNIIFFLIVES